jgi:hypothetical protein
MPKIESVDQAKALATNEFRKIHPYGVTFKMNAQRMSAVWIVTITYGSPAREMEYRIDANSGQTWKIK